MHSGIYTITNTQNGKIYVGYSKNLKTRKNKHFRDLLNKKHDNFYLQLDFDEYGKENFSYDILEECDEQLLASQENYWCNMLNVHNRDYGYNILPTNPYFKHSISKETRLKISKANKGKPSKLKGIKWTEQQKLNAGLKNRISNRKGVMLSEETKQKIRIAKINMDNETKVKISKSLKDYFEKNISPIKGRKYSEEHKQKLSNAHKGKEGYWKNKTRSKETIEKMNKNRSIVTHLHSGKTFGSLAEACKELNLSYSKERKLLKTDKTNFSCRKK